MENDEAKGDGEMTDGKRCDEDRDDGKGEREICARIDNFGGRGMREGEIGSI